MAIIVLPKGVSFNLWANQLQIDLPGRNIANMDEKTQWKDFATELYVNPSLVNVPMPHIERYNGENGKQQWTEEFINNIYL